MNRLPNELWNKIFTNLSLRDLSSMLYVNKYYNNLFKKNKWVLLDYMEKIGYFIPKNIETYNEYRYCIDWTKCIMEEKVFEEDTLIKLHDVIDYSLISTKQKFSDNFIRRYYLEIPTINLVVHQIVPIDILWNMIDKTDFSPTYWYNIWKKQTVNLEFIDKYVEYVDWNVLSANKESLKFDVIMKYHDKLLWPEITKHGITEDIINMFIDKLFSFSWYNISYYSKLSCQFIRNHLDKLHIISLLNCQELGEDLIYEIINRTDDEDDKISLWYKIASHQKIGKQFIQYNLDKLPLQLLIRNENIKKSWLKEIFG